MCATVGSEAMRDPQDHALTVTLHLEKLPLWIRVFISCDK